MGSDARLKHNKKRNTGLVYEFLIRKLSQSLVEKDVETYKNSFSLIKRYFSPEQPLMEEKRLFDVLMTTKVQNRQSAVNLLGEVKLNASKLNFRFLDIKKSNLIKEINKKFGQDFFTSYKLEEYKKLASIQLLINGCNKKRTLQEGVDRTIVEQHIISFLLEDNKQNEQSKELVKYDEIVQMAAMRKFNERYGKTLCESQKQILKKYFIKKLSNKDNEIRSFISETKENLVKQIVENSSIKEVKESKMVKDKLDESISYYRNMKVDDNFDALIEEIMLGYKLLEELKSNE